MAVISEATGWERNEELTLFNYVVTHFQPNRLVDWSEISSTGLQKSKNQCVSKYYRMLRNPYWKFKKHARRHQAQQLKRFCSKDLDELIHALSRTCVF